MGATLGAATPGVLPLSREVAASGGFFGGVGGLFCVLGDFFGASGGFFLIMDDVLGLSSFAVKKSLFSPVGTYEYSFVEQIGFGNRF